MTRRHAIVTGGSSGIGLAVARRLLADGFDLTLVARRPALLRQARESLLRAAGDGRDVAVLSADVSSRQDAEAAVAEAVTSLGAPAAVVTCAGMAEPGRFAELPAEAFERAIAVNYLGTVHVVRAALPAMRPGSRIVMLSSGAGLIGLYGYTAYSPAKFALRGFAQALHAELRHQGIGVSIAFPPDTDTPQLAAEQRAKPRETRMMTGAAGLWSADEVAARIVAGMQRGRFAITPGLALSLLYRLDGVAGPLLQSLWAWRVARLRRAAPAMAERPR